MSGNLCRCGAYPNIVDAIMEVLEKRAAVMNPFSYVRTSDVAEAVREAGSVRGVKFIAGGTNLST